MKKLILSLAVFALCSCETTFPVSFHMEAAEGQGKKFTIPDQQSGKIYDKVPFISQKDFENYRSFPAADGYTYGVVFQAKRTMIPRIEAYTSTNLGNCILPMVNGHPMEVTQLKNQPIRTGQLVVWSGFSAADLATLSEVVEPTPEEAQKNMQAYSKDGIRILSKDKDEEQSKQSKDTDSQGRKIISERRGRF